MSDIIEVLDFFKEIGVEFFRKQESDIKNFPSKQYLMSDLNNEIFSCKKCGLYESKTNYVPGEGSLNPDIMFIGEGPGENEDKTGRPFVGKAGELLTNLIKKMGYSRESVFIGNIVKCRPPGNRNPRIDEAAACIPYLQRQIEILNPKVMVCLGRVALNFLLNNDESITKARGKLFYYYDIPVIPTFHPSYILHQRTKQAISDAKWKVWDDMQKVLEILNK